MMHGTRTCAIAAALIAAGIPPAVAGKNDDTVRFAVQTTPGNVDPYFSNLAGSGQTIWDNVWDGLVWRDSETGAYQGNLATAWRRIDDRTLEFDLRRGVKFHNGADFDADDVVFTFNFVSDPKSRSAAMSYVGWIDHAVKIDKYRVRIIAKQPSPAAIGYLASPRLAIFPHAYYAAVGPKGMNAHPVGTGPYRVTEHALGKYLRLERNTQHLSGAPKAQPRIAKAEIRFIPDAQTLVAEVVSGGADLISDVTRDQANELRDISGLQVISGETARYDFLLINSRKDSPSPPLRDIRVRQAINYAIDREAMVKFLAGEQARLVYSECHPAEFGCSDDGVKHYSYDPARARKLLADAGYSRGFDVDIYAYRDRNHVEALIGYLRAVGIRARLHYLQTEAAIAARRAGKTPLAFIAAAALVYELPSALAQFNEFSFDDLNRDPEVRNLLVEGDTALDQQVRRSAYNTANQLIAERAYAVPLYSLPTHYVAASNLMFRPNKDEILRFYEMSWK